MKKYLVLLMAIVFTVILTTVAFAETPAGSGTNTSADQYQLDDGEIAQGSGADSAIKQNSTDITLEDDKTPLAPTGGIPAEAFYVVGGLCIGSALLLTKKKSKAATK